MTDVKVEIRGLRELSAAFRKVDADIPKQLRSKFLPIAEKVARTAQGKVPHVTGRAAGSIKPRASQRGASIAFGGTAAPYMPWLDFGGKVGRNKSVERPFIKEGRYIYPTIIGARDETEQAAADAVEQAAREASFETRGT